MTINRFDLDGQVVIITGGAGLLGRQHADAVASSGGIPVILDLKAELAKNLAKELEMRYGVSAKGYAVDITKEAEIEANAAELYKQFGKIDALINNAANNPKVENQDGRNFSRLENFSLADWNADIAVGLTGAFLCAKHYGSEIFRNPNGGVIINISSDLGLIAPDQRLYSLTGLSEDQQPVKPVTYSVIKSGLIGLTRYLATYWPNKVRCNALCPGGVEAGQSSSFLKEISTRIPMGRLAKQDEYKGVLIFMLADESSYLNGATIPMDGGRSVW
jgi:NAD(P)-dependent dehydrogenase (short-subunit alcohol dehydrogenase family)